MNQPQALKSPQAHDALPDRLLTYKHASEQVGVSARTIRAWVANGKLPARWISKRCVRVWQSDVLRLSSNQTPPASVLSAEPTIALPVKWKGRTKVKASDIQLPLAISLEGVGQ